MPTEHLTYNDEAEFQEWLKEVDKLCRAKFQLDLNSLSDLNTRDAFTAGTTPAVFFEDDVLPMMREEYGDLIDQL